MIETIGLISSIATLISFVIGFIWNYQSSRQAIKSNAEMYKKFAENIISIRRMEIERVNAEVDRLNREAEALQIIRDTKLNYEADGG